MFIYLFVGIVSHWLRFLNLFASGWMPVGIRARKAMGTCSQKAGWGLSPSVTLHHKIHSSLLQPKSGCLRLRCELLWSQ